MDIQNKVFYRLNKNSADLIFNHLDELVIYRKNKDSSGKETIIEIKKGSNNCSKRVLGSHEMSIEQFDAWKQWLTDDSHMKYNEDMRQSRNNVSSENLLESELMCTNSLEEDYIQKEECILYEKKLAMAKELFDVLTIKQQRRFYKHFVLNIPIRAIANEEKCAPNAIQTSLASAKKRLEKEMRKSSIE